MFGIVADSRVPKCRSYTFRRGRTVSRRIWYVQNLLGRHREQHSRARYFGKHRLVLSHLCLIGGPYAAHVRCCLQLPDSNRRSIQRCEVRTAFEDRSSVARSEQHSKIDPALRSQDSIRRSMRSVPCRERSCGNVELSGHAIDLCNGCCWRPQLCQSIALTSHDF